MSEPKSRSRSQSRPIAPEYSDQSSLSRAVRDNRVLLATIAFVVVCLVASVAVDAVGFSTVAAMIVAFAIIMVAATVLFVLLPVYLLEYI